MTQSLLYIVLGRKGDLVKNITKVTHAQNAMEIWLKERVREGGKQAENASFSVSVKWE